MRTQIVLHLLPQEIDWFEWQSKQLKQGSYYLSSEDTILIDVTLNLNLVKWEDSHLPKEFFINKFKQIEQLWDWAETNFAVDVENKCLGCDDKRREAIRTTNCDNILYLDSDLIFTPELLYYVVESAKNIPSEYYIVSPEIYKLWDNTWDVLVNKKYVGELPSMESYYGKDPFRIAECASDSIDLRPVKGFKFGGGWFNLISSKLLKLTDMPDSFGPYGIDDLYVMICCDMLHQKGYDVKQYVLEGAVVIENFKYRCNPYKDFLSLINKQAEFREQAEAHLHTEIKNFIDRI